LPVAQTAAGDIYQTPNQSLEPTQHFVVSFRLMSTLILKVLGGVSLSR
jgi:hypothetical protein